MNTNLFLFVDSPQKTSGCSTTSYKNQDLRKSQVIIGLDWITMQNLFVSIEWLLQRIIVIGLCHLSFHLKACFQRKRKRYWMVSFYSTLWRKILAAVSSYMAIYELDIFTELRTVRPNPQSVHKSQSKLIISKP